MTFTSQETRDAISEARAFWIDSQSHPDELTRIAARHAYDDALTKVARLLDTSYDNAERIIQCLD